MSNLSNNIIDAFIFINHILPYTTIDYLCIITSSLHADDFQFNSSLISSKGFITRAITESDDELL